MQSTTLKILIISQIGQQIPKT
uniref:Uncharacterized protein n=1 Tax=Rhizophora mucronata TaxID=61149 RepID=A0A2P2PFE1_RHIMU